MKMNSRGRRTGITMNKKLGSTLIAMTIIIFMLFLTLGMFTKNFGGSASAEIAAPQTSIVEGKLLDVTSDENNTTNKGIVDVEDTGGYFFSVKNTDKDGNNRTQVKMQYKIVVETATTDTSGNQTYNGNVDYTLYSADTTDPNQPVATGDAIISTENDSDGNPIFSTSDMTLDINNDEVKNYILKFKPSNDGQFQFKVKVISEQVD